MRFINITVFIITRVFVAARKFYPDEAFNDNDDDDDDDIVNNQNKSNSKKQQVGYHNLNIEKTKQTTKSPTHPFDRFRNLYLIVQASFFAFNVLLLLKYGLFYLLELGYLVEYKYLSCVLLGRILIFAGSPTVARYFAPYSAMMNIIWNGELLCYSDRFFFYSAEFLMIGRKKLHKFEQSISIDHARRANFRENLHTMIDRPVSKSSSPFVQTKEGRRSTLHQSLTKVRTGKRSSTNNVIDGDLSSLAGDLYQPEIRLDYSKQSIFKRGILLDLFYLSVRQNNYNQVIYQKRFNRTLKAWRHLETKCLRAFIEMCTIIGIVSILCVALEYPKVLSLEGFQVSYQQCVEWILSERQRSLTFSASSETKQKQQHLLYAYIYPLRVSANYSLAEPDDSLIFPKINNWIPFNWYHVTRIMLDGFEVAIVSVQAIWGLALCYVLCVLIAEDVCYYSQRIEKHLIYLMNEMSEFNRLAVDRFHWKQKLRSKLLDRKIQKLQACIEDLLRLIVGYNRFIEPTTWRYLFVWITFTALTSSYLFRPSPKWTVSLVESYIIQAMFAIIYIPLVHTFAEARQDSRKLYHLLASCSALDQSRDEKKIKWIRLMQIFYPKSLNAFTVKERGISWLIALQFFAWLLSALFVLTTFRII